jgi:hypothetical protein
MVERFWQTDRGGKTVKRTAVQRRKTPGLPITWRDAEYSALCAIAADTCDDRVSEDIFDIEDEWAEVDIIVHRTYLSAN